VDYLVSEEFSFTLLRSVQIDFGFYRSSASQRDGISIIIIIIIIVIIIIIKFI
jgi:hypothetical protein